MQKRVRKILTGIPVISTAYRFARLHRFELADLWTAWAAWRYFTNYTEYFKALRVTGPGTVDIWTNDGLRMTIRRNIWDARILQEIFLNNPYVLGVKLRQHPTVVDIGGYIGDFSLFAVKHLQARRVIVYEPSRKNFALLMRNIENNGCGDVIAASNMAVGDSSEVFMNVDVPDVDQVNVSAFQADRAGAEVIPSITLADLIDRHQLDAVDLLKLDCEGGEYPILLGAPLSVFRSIHNIVLEYHPFDGYECRLGAVEDKLRAAGYAVKEHRMGCFLSAVRA